MEDLIDSVDVASVSAFAGLEFLTFKLGQEEYGLDIQHVQELRSYETVTRIANAPDYLKGVVNLRGIIVPIIDLRIKFHFAHSNYDQFTVVVILNIAGKMSGIVVDSVSDVITLARTQIRKPPSLDKVHDTDYLLGLGTVNERMLILVDIAKMITSPALLDASLDTLVDTSI